MASITTMLPDQCIVLRDEAQTSVSAIDLVPRDMIFVEQGNKLPVDVRLVEVSVSVSLPVIRTAIAIVWGNWLID